MSAYYGKAYNSYSLDRPIKTGDRVQIVERCHGSITVLWAGAVERIDSRKATEGYTVLVLVDDSTIPTRVWARPDEVRQVRS